MTAPTDALVTGWLLARVRRGPVRLLGAVPGTVVHGLTRGGFRVVADDPEAVRPDAADASLVVDAAAGGTPPAATVAALAEATTAADGEAPLLTVAVLAGPDALGAPDIEALTGDAPWAMAEDHLVVGEDQVVWIARWSPAAAGDELATRLATRLADAAGALAVGASALRQETQRLSAHARNVERQLTAARQASDQAERMHNRLAADVSRRAAEQEQRAAERSSSPVSASEAKALTRKAAGKAGRLVSKVAGRVLSSVGGDGDGADAGLRRSESKPAGRRDTTSGRQTAAPFRIGLLGDQADLWLGGFVRTVTVERDWVGSLVASADHLEAVVVAADVDGWSDADRRRLVEEAKEAGIPVLGLRTDPTVTPWFDGLVDLEIVPDAAAAAPDRTTAPRPADPSVWHPIGWRREATPLLAVMTDRELDTPVAERLASVVGSRDALCVVGDAEPPEGFAPAPTQHDGTFLGRLRPVRGVVDHPRLHAHPGAQAARLVELAMANVPLLCVDLPEAVAGLLGPELATALRATTLEDLRDPDQRERRAVDARRAAWRSHTIEARWRQLLPDLGLPVPRRRTMSIVIATNRPDRLPDALRQVATQSWPDTELIVGLHGEDFAPSTHDEVTSASPFPTRVVPVPVDQPLGEVLNRACQVAAGDVVAKWDDDDFYGPDHVVDLLMALEASGATLVGKGSEFVYLAEIDVTIRRATRGAHSGSRTMGGGTLAIGREDLRGVGWWPHTPHTVDQRLMDAVLAAGGTLHRTHGLGFILNRHGVGHTWAAEVDYFLQHSESQRRGLDLVFAGIARD